MLDSYIRNCFMNLNRRVTALEENKNKPTVPSGEEEEEDAAEEDENRKYVVTVEDLNTAVHFANFRSVNISKQINPNYEVDQSEDKYITNKDDPTISLEVIHGRARMGTLNITEDLIKEVKTTNEDGVEEEEYYEYLSTNEAYTKEEIDGNYGTKITNNTNSIKRKTCPTILSIYIVNPINITIAKLTKCLTLNILIIIYFLICQLLKI